MDALVKQAWVGALRSDRFRRGAGNLAKHGENGIEHCCLGVLCELAIEAGVQLDRQDDDFSLFFDGQESYPPRAVIAWAGLAGQVTSVGDVIVKSASVIPDDVRESITANDAPLTLGSINDHRVPWDVIAKVIDDQL